LVYIADNKNFPYGEKKSLILKKIISKTIKIINKVINPKMIVLACNSASVTALAALRKEFQNLLFVGVVPAVKPAAKNSELKRIGLLATSRTVEDRYTDLLIEDFASDCHVIRSAQSDIVQFVEKKYFISTHKQKEAFINNSLKHIQKNEIDFLILGCTHFIFLENEIKKALNDHITIIDSREGVGNQVIRLIREKQLESSNHETIKNDLFVTSLKQEKQYQHFSNQFNLDFKGKLI
jgi:glutamate racemase